MYLNLILTLIPYFSIVCFGTLLFDFTLPSLVVSVILSSYSFGALKFGEKALNIKYDFKKVLTLFLHSKMYQEKLEELICYDKESYKIFYENEITKKMIDNADKDIGTSEKISAGYNLVSCDRMKEHQQLIDDVKFINKKLEKMYQELDGLITKKILYGILSNITPKSLIVKITSFILTILGVFLGLGLSFYQISLSTPSVIFIIFCLILPVTIFDVTMLKKNSNLIKIFNKLNLQLGNEALNNNKSMDEIRNELEKINSSLDSKIEKISASQLLLLEKKQILESLSSIEEVKEDKQNSQNLNLQQFIVQEESTATLVEEGPKLVKRMKHLR